MKVTCGSCFRALVVEDWLADNVARCPKCGEVIRIPKSTSPPGANAVVLSVDEATELLRKRAAEGQSSSAKMATSAGQGPAPPTSSASEPAGVPSGSKTEPLPAFLKHASSAIHAEPEQQKTRPLPRPQGHSSPGIGPVVPPDMPPAPKAAPLPPADLPRYAPIRASQLTPLVPIAFVLGLLIGGVCGWLIGRSLRAQGPASADAPVVQTPAPLGEPVADSRPPGDGELFPGVRPTPAGPPAGEPSTTRPPPAGNGELFPNVKPAPATSGEPARPPVQVPPPQFQKSDWLSAQPPGALAQIAGPVAVSRRIAAVGGLAGARNLYYPAPVGHVYLDVKVRLGIASGKSIALPLAGSDAGCWLLTRDGKVFEPLGAPVSSLGAGQADAKAVVTLDAARQSADVEVRFLVPAELPAARLAFAQSQYVDLPPESLAAGDPTGGRDLGDSAWVAVAVQNLAQDYPEQPFMAALATADKGHQLRLKRQGDGYDLEIEKLGISGTVRRTADAGHYSGSLKLNDRQADVTVRVFDASQTLVVYFAAEPLLQFAYTRYQEKLDWE